MSAAIHHSPPIIDGQSAVGLRRLSPDPNSNDMFRFQRNDSDVWRDAVGNEFSCDKCTITFNTIKEHQRHMNNYHRDAMTLPFVCKSCGMGFYSRMGWKEHEMKHQGLVFRCVVCSASFDIKRGLERHMARVHNKKECRHCGVVFEMNARQPHVCNQGR